MDEKVRNLTWVKREGPGSYQNEMYFARDKGTIFQLVLSRLLRVLRMEDSQVSYVWLK